MECTLNKYFLYRKAFIYIYTKYCFYLYLHYKQVIFRHEQTGTVRTVLHPYV